VIRPAIFQRRVDGDRWLSVTFTTGTIEPYDQTESTLD